MNSGYVVLTVVILLLSAAVMVVAAFFDRRRGREIAHDPSRVPEEWREQIRARHRERREDRWPDS